MVDVFEEVEEQIRAERWKSLGLKLLPWAIAIAVAGALFAGGLWGWDYWTRTQGEKAAQSYVEALTAASRGDTAKADTLLAEVAKSSAKGYPSMALMAQAGLRQQEDKTQEAVALLDQAADKATDPVVEDLARLKSALALLDTAPYKELEGRLTPLMADKRPYRLEAREALGFAKIMHGKNAEARKDFVFLTSVLGASDSMRQRARAATALIDSGTASSIPAIVKAAATLPPPAPGLPQGMMPAQPQAQQGPAQ